MGAAALACTVFIPVNNQIADHQAQFFAVFEDRVQSCFNGEYDNATTCNDLPSKMESMQSALSPLKKNPEPLSKSVELPLNVFGLKLLWEVSVLDTVNGPACLCDGLQEMDECRAVELIMQGQDYADLRSDLSIANMSTGWASDIHKKLLALLWQGNHIRIEPTPCPNCRAFINQLNEDRCEKIVVTTIGKEKFVKSFSKAASKRSNKSKSEAQLDVAERFATRITKLRGKEYDEANQLLENAKSKKLIKRIATTTTPLGDVVHEVLVWTPDYDWVNDALLKIESRFDRKNTDGSLMEFQECITNRRPERPWANVYPTVGECDNYAYKIKISLEDYAGDALVIVKNDEDQIINHRYLEGPVSAWMRVGGYGWYDVFFITGRDFSFTRKVLGPKENLQGYFDYSFHYGARVYANKHANREVSITSPNIVLSSLKEILN